MLLDNLNQYRVLMHESTFTCFLNECFFNYSVLKPAQIFQTDQTKTVKCKSLLNAAQQQIFKRNSLVTVYILSITTSIICVLFCFLY